VSYSTTIPAMLPVLLLLISGGDRNVVGGRHDQLEA
jgi:hypothetical protein